MIPGIKYKQQLCDLTSCKGIMEIGAQNVNDFCEAFDSLVFCDKPCQ